jgi:hypothetical protein|tara:strand:+ start:416 stop:625 length:210 start_codon:yes stop_codon:yes gene_type:complete
MAHAKKCKFEVLDLVRMKPLKTCYGIQDAGIGMVVEVDTVTSLVHVMFPSWEKSRPMHPSVIEVINENQ